MNFPEQLKKLRLEYNMTQKELADKINSSPSKVGMWEAGKRDPNTEDLILLCKIFDVSSDYILGKSEIRNPYESHARIRDSLEDDPELLEFWEVLKEREDLQLMFKQTKQMSPKDIRQIIKIIKAIEDEEDAEN